MRVALHSCFILHKRSYRESSLLLDLFSSKHGRISLVAKGGRRNKKNTQALYQPYRSLNVSWAGRGEMGTLTGIDAIGAEFDLKGEQVIAAFYLNELLIRLLHKHESHPELFEAYLVALTRLAHSEPIMMALRYFEKHLLNALGYGLVLDHDVESGEPIRGGQDYYYKLDHGPCFSKPVNTAYISISGNTLLALDREELNEGSAQEEAKQLMRMTLKTLLGEKPMASRDLYKAYLQQKC
ncbi:MAG: DNA repair protein RecO [Gammaproteobacteria bacterium]|jgi:DNA repair protein RecO (recombination protein O)|nr:DNA repair protein RecO [Gammaproteobacteria bacterium]